MLGSTTVSMFTTLTECSAIHSLARFGSLRSPPRAMVFLTQFFLVGLASFALVRFRHAGYHHHAEHG